MGPILELDRLSKHYPGHCAVDGICLTIPRGAFFSLLGPSGCGKTTTLRLIAGFEEPTSGDIRLHGELINRRKPYERNVSTVFQNYALFPHLTVRENVEFGLRRRGAADAAERARSAIELVRLSGKEERRPADLSGGERQRAALARSLVVEPDVLLLDEPLSALDPNLRKQMRSELKSLQRRVGITFLFVTHDQEEALSMSDCIALMHQGRIEQVGTPEALYLRPASRFAASFLGSINWIDGAGVRPESIHVARGADDLPRARPAKIEQSVFLGDAVHLEARLAGGAPVRVHVPRHLNSFRPGDDVQLWWEPEDELHFEP
jgi:ABC-type Fe3+/spermidine/putrescine transport system ATPase subunit